MFKDRTTKFVKSAYQYIRSTSLRKDEHGASLIEAALTVPFLITLIMGIAQYGLIFSSYVSLRTTAAATARYAAVIRDGNASAAEIQAFAVAQAGTSLDSSLITATPTVETLNVGAQSYTVTTVRLTYPMQLFFPYVVPNTVGRQLTLTAETTMQ